MDPRERFTMTAAAFPWLKFFVQIAPMLACVTFLAGVGWLMYVIWQVGFQLTMLPYIAVTMLVVVAVMVLRDFAACGLVIAAEARAVRTDTPG